MCVRALKAIAQFMCQNRVMAEETTPAEETAPAGLLRENGSDPFKKTVVAAICGLPIPPQASPAAGTIDISVQWISLHITDPGSTQATATASEIPTTGVYKRQRVTWGAPDAIIEGGLSKGRITGTVPAFDVPAGTIAHYGVWAGGTNTGGGTYLYGKPLSAQITLGSAGKVTITPTHSYGLLAPS
jgi:hypothetical protein